MTKQHLKALQDIQGKIKKAVSYIQKDSTFICSNVMPHNLSYYDKDGKGLTPMNKHTGTDLCYLYSALENITGIINDELNPLKTFTFLLHHDNGKTKISTKAADLESARTLICKAENCPPIALELYC